jgi:hypothetical protein
MRNGSVIKVQNMVNNAFKQQAGLVSETATLKSSANLGQTQ